MRRGPPERVLAQAGHRAIVDDHALLVAPRRVPDLASLQARGVAGDDAVDQPGGTGTLDAVLEQRRDVDHGTRVPDRVVFVIVVRLVGADGVVAGPVAEAQALGQRRRALVEGGSDRHEGIIEAGACRVQGAGCRVRCGVPGAECRVAAPDVFCPSCASAPFARGLLATSAALIVGVTLATVAYVSLLADRTVSARVAADLERSRRGVAAAEAEQFARLELIAELVASFPELRALLATDAATVRDFLADYRERHGHQGAADCPRPGGHRRRAGATPSRH